MYQIEANSMNEAYTLIAKDLVAAGAPAVGRQNGMVHELRDVAIVLREPRKCLTTLPWRKLSRRYCAGEFALFCSCETNVEAYEHYAKKWRELDVDGTVCSAYGQRIFSAERDGLGFSRFDYALEQLTHNPESKNAVIMMRDYTDNRPTHQKDRCCTLFLQFSIRNGALDMTVHMRSSDFWFGLPYDIFWYSFVMQRMLLRVNQETGYGIRLGTYTHVCSSLHVYAAQWEKVKNAQHPSNIIAEKEYAMPVYTDADEKRLAEWLEWERTLRIDDCPLEIAASNLRNSKYKPFLETMGSFLLNKINTRYATFEDKLIIKEAETASADSVCIDRKVGCFLICEEGNLTSCNEVIRCNKQCDDKENRICEVTHAEVAALRKAEEKGWTPITAYVTLYPCFPCMQALTAAGVKEIVVFGFSHKGATGTVTLIDPSLEVL